MLSTLHVHHKYYEPGKKPWEYPDEALITLCESCHSDEEGFKEATQDEIKAMLSAGFSYYEIWTLLLHERLKITEVQPEFPQEPESLDLSLPF